MPMLELQEMWAQQEICWSFSVAQSYLTLRHPMDCHMPSFSALYHFPELDGDAIKPSYPLSSPSLLAFNLSQHHVFSNESVLCIRWPKQRTFSFSISPSNKHSGLISCRIDWFDLFSIRGTLKSLLQDHSSKPAQQATHLKM